MVGVGVGVRVCFLIALWRLAASIIVAVKQADIANTAPVTADRVYDYPDGILLPGLIDLHAHPAPGEWRWGIDADTMMLRRGSTTVMSQGDAGAHTWQEYRERILEPAATRIMMALSPAVLGERAGRCGSRGGRRRRWRGDFCIVLPRSAPFP